MHTNDSEPGEESAPSRRTFLRLAGGWTLAGLGLALAPVQAARAATAERRGPRPMGPSSPSHPGRATVPDPMDRETFAGHAGSEFTFHLAGQAATMTLQEVQDRRRPAALAQPNGECFALRFRGPADAALEQGTYRVEHARLGAFDLFIVPTGADAHGRFFEALFNRTVG